MKNAIVKFSLTALAAFTLAACGSSGGGNSDNTAAASHDQKTQVTPSKTNLQHKIQLRQIKPLRVQLLFSLNKMTRFKSKMLNSTTQI